jgi:hypothetical protein
MSKECVLKSGDKFFLRFKDGKPIMTGDYTSAARYNNVASMNDAITMLQGVGINAIPQRLMLGDEADPEQEI